MNFKESLTGNRMLINKVQTYRSKNLNEIVSSINELELTSGRTQLGRLPYGSDNIKTGNVDLTLLH